MVTIWIKLEGSEEIRFVALFPDTGYALEVFNEVGETIDVILVPASIVKPLSEDEILQARSLTSAR